MIIEEISRISQLTARERVIVDKASAEYGVTVSALAEQISHVVNGMDVADAIKAANWYFDAHNFATYLAEEYEVSVEIAAGIISAVSPRMPWLRNKMVAQSILMQSGAYADLSAVETAKELKLGMSANIAMAVKIARGAFVEDALTGIKRKSFYNNIVAPKQTDSVTVDTWMQLAFCRVTGKPKADAISFVRANEKALKEVGAGYILIAEAVRVVAAEMSLFPHQIQAMYWVEASGSYNGGREDIN